jgi:hypothetical protein
VLLQAGVVGIVGLAAARLVNGVGTMVFMALAFVAVSRLGRRKVTCPPCRQTLQRT